MDDTKQDNNNNTFLEWLSKRNERVLDDVYVMPPG